MKIKIVDYSIYRKYYYWIFIPFLIDLIVFMFSFSPHARFVDVGYEFSKTEMTLLVISFLGLVLFTILYLLFLFITPKKEILIIRDENYTYKKKTYPLETLCLDINTHHIIDKIKEKSNTKEILLNNYRKIPKTGNFIIDKKNGIKLEFIIKNRKQFESLVNKLKICNSNRKSIKNSSLILGILEIFGR